MMILFDGDISRGRSQQDKSILCCFVVVLCCRDVFVCCYSKKSKSKRLSFFFSLFCLRLRISQNDCEKEIKEERRGLMATPNMTTNKQTKQTTDRRPTDTKIQTRNKTEDTSDTNHRNTIVLKHLLS
jgi:hypothetical protein